MSKGNPMTALTDSQRTLLAAVLDRLLPPHQELAGAGSLGLGAKLEEEANLVPANGQAMLEVLQRLPADFVKRTGDEQDELLRAVEAEMPATFFSLIVMAYNAYYTDGRVLKVIERLTGYEARPPQPQGYVLEPFDERILEKVKQRQPFYRRV
jgi:hypothetical protein